MVIKQKRFFLLKRFWTKSCVSQFQIYCWRRFINFDSDKKRM